AASVTGAELDGAAAVDPSVGWVADSDADGVLLDESSEQLVRSAPVAGPGPQVGAPVRGVPAPGPPWASGEGHHEPVPAAVGVLAAAHPRPARAPQAAPCPRPARAGPAARPATGRRPRGGPRVRAGLARGGLPRGVGPGQPELGRCLTRLPPGSCSSSPTNGR